VAVEADLVLMQDLLRHQEDLAVAGDQITQVTRKDSVGLVLRTKDLMVVMVRPVLIGTAAVAVEQAALDRLPLILLVEMAELE
jgi:hypothetical protein